MISVNNLSYTYEMASNIKFKAVENINFSLVDGDILGIVGKTGSGKSTLVRMLNGLLTPTSGEVILNGKNVHKDFKNSSELFFKVGLVFQYPEHQLFEKTVFDDIAFGLRNKNTSEQEIKKIIEKTITILGIDKNLLSRSPLELSGGEKRKCAIAGVIAMNPEVLILDEPTAGLDYQSKKQLMKCLNDYCKVEKKIVIFISHVLEEVIDISNKLLVMDSGKAEYYGDTKELFKNSTQLKQIGLFNNQITDIMSLISERFPKISRNILTINQAKEEILKLLK